MRRSTLLLIAGTEIAVISWWFLGLRFETGIDSMQYHRMASAIVKDGLAPWAINPLSYIGVYPGSDSSGVPFLAATFSILSGLPMNAAVLAYDATLFPIFGLSLFVLTRRLTGRTDLAIIAIAMGSLAFGFFTSLSWSLEERTFNAALTPLFLFLMFPIDGQRGTSRSAPRLAALGLVSIVMFVSHLSFLLLIPFLVLVPLINDVAGRQFALRRTRKASIIYFCTISVSPLVLLVALDQLGILGDLRLQIQLESSALLSGSSAPAFLLNSLVFISTRVGPVAVFLAALGMLYLGTRPYLPSERVALGGLLLAAFLGLPIVLYSKDLLIPVLVILASIGLGAIVRPMSRGRVPAVTLAAALVIAGSIAFNAWNVTRTSNGYERAYWTPSGVTAEAGGANLWLSHHRSSADCVVGNNGIAVQQVTLNPGEPLCIGIPMDVMINAGTALVLSPGSLRVVFHGFTSVNPGNWYASPDLDRITNELTTLPSLDFAAGRALLLKYHVGSIVVDLQRPDQVPLFLYEGSRFSPFFAQLWTNLYPSYRTTNFAVFEIE